MKDAILVRTSCASQVKVVEEMRCCRVGMGEVRRDHTHRQQTAKNSAPCTADESFAEQGLATKTTPQVMFCSFRSFSTHILEKVHCQSGKGVDGNVINLAHGIFVLKCWNLFELGQHLRLKARVRSSNV